MKPSTQILITASFVLLASIPFNALGQSRASRKLSPKALVADLYRQHNQKHSPFFQTRSRARVDQYFTKLLADLIWKDAHGSKGEVGALDGDPLYNAQDTSRLVRRNIRTARLRSAFHSKTLARKMSLSSNWQKMETFGRSTT